MSIVSGPLQLSMLFAFRIKIQLCKLCYHCPNKRYVLCNVGKHKLLGTLMVGMVPTIGWKRMNLVFGVSTYLILAEIQPFITIQGSNSDSSMVMEFGLIEFQLGLDMPLWTPQNLEHHMMVSTGILHLQKGDSTFTYCEIWTITIIKLMKDQFHKDPTYEDGFLCLYCRSFSSQKYDLFIFLDKEDLVIWKKVFC